MVSWGVALEIAMCYYPTSCGKGALLCWEAILFTLLSKWELVHLPPNPDLMAL